MTENTTGIQSMGRLLVESPMIFILTASELKIGSRNKLKGRV